MRTGVSLADIRTEVLIEAGFSTDPGHSAFSKERLDQMIARTERMMAREKTWPGIHFEERVAIGANVQYVDLPDDIASSDIKSAHVGYGDDWLPVTYGIGPVERSIYNESQRAAPIARWEVVAPGDEKFEVWPIGSYAQTLMFTGSKRLGEFKNDASCCTLDADVIVLRVAAQILGRDRKEDARLMLQQANSMTNDLLKDQNTTRAEINMGGNRGVRRLRPGIDYIPSGG